MLALLSFVAQPVVFMLWFNWELCVNAQLAYQSHPFTTDDTRGRYMTTWSPMSGFNYQSPLAESVSSCVWNYSKSLAFQISDCYIEAQYDEFLSLVNYQTLDTGRALTIWKVWRKPLTISLPSI